MNIVIATHGPLAESLKYSAEMIVGKMDNIYTLSLTPELSFEDFYKKAEETVKEIEGHTIYLVDLFGGTPSNVFTVLGKKYSVPVVTGVNLPALIDLYLSTLNQEDINIDEVVNQLIETIQNSGVNTNKLV